MWLFHIQLKYCCYFYITGWFFRVLLFIFWGVFLFYVQNTKFRFCCFLGHFFFPCLFFIAIFLSYFYVLWMFFQNKKKIFWSVFLSYVHNTELVFFGLCFCAFFWSCFSVFWIIFQNKNKTFPTSIRYGSVTKVMLVFLILIFLLILSDFDINTCRILYLKEFLGQF